MNNLYFNLHEIVIGNYIGVNQLILEELVSSLEKILLEPSVRCGFSKNTVHNRKANSYKSNNDKPWFDENCRNKRNEYFRVKNILKKSKSNDNRLKIESKKYKKFIRNTSRKYFKKFHADIRNFKTKDPKKFWNLMSNKNKKTTFQ